MFSIRILLYSHHNTSSENIQTDTVGFFVVYRKIFVGGIATTTSKAKLIGYFAKYGTIEDCIVMVDRD